ncbi:MAG TPA: RNase adapter RapZ [Candidatus Acidoferrales bacterium]|nr:RNase adapter RapZ [Candidatus Acidoferrales bacterium]
MTPARVVFVAGLSGAGKSQAIKTFEDLGFYCVEHLPPTVLAATLRALDAARAGEIAITLAEHFALLGDALTAIEATAQTRPVDVLFLEARDDALVRRFSETRRRHPFESRGSLREAIAAEREALLPLRERATMTIDTTALNHAGLKERLAAAFAPNERARLTVTIVPFGFKYGLPLDLDLLFDVRFLRNPNYDDTLRPLTGEDEAVVKFIEADPACEPFVAKLCEMVDFLVPRYIAEGKARVTIGIGCTGGRHRSVYIAERLYRHLARDERLALAVDPRDSGR